MELKDLLDVISPLISQQKEMSDRSHQNIHEFSVSLLVFSLFIIIVLFIFFSSIFLKVTATLNQDSVQV